MTDLKGVRGDLERDPRAHLRIVTFDGPPVPVTPEEDARSQDLQRRYPDHRYPRVSFGTVGGKHEGRVDLRKGCYAAIEDTRTEVLDKLDEFLADLGGG